MLLETAFATTKERLRSAGGSVETTEIKPEWILLPDEPLINDFGILTENTKLQIDARIDLEQRYADVVAVATKGMNDHERADWFAQKTKQLIRFGF